MMRLTGQEVRLVEDAQTAIIRDWYRGAESAGRLIAECSSFKELDEALAREYKLQHHPGVNGETEAQKAIKEIRNKLIDWKEGE